MSETTQQDEDSILEWVWGAVQGDFNEDPTAGQIITNAVITAIPVVDQVADARDLAASVKALLWDKRHDDFEVWLAFFFTLIGLVPSVGSLLKGVLKLVWKGAKLDAILRVFNAFAKGNGVAWLKQLRAGGLREYSKQAAELGKKVLDNVSATLREAMEYIPSWAGGIYQRMSDLLAELAIIRSKIEDVFNKITLGMEEKLDDLLKEKKINSAQGSSKSTLMVRQEADEVPLTGVKLSREERLEGLAADPAHNGKVTPKTLQEAEVGLSLEESGHLKPPIQRDPRPDGGEFIDADGQVWDVKAFDSRWPPRKGGFKLDRDLAKIEDEIAKNENVILDTTNLTEEHYLQLRKALTDKGVAHRIKWWPPELNDKT
ncbi:MAG: hypothetical protein MI808_09330 [Pseudomonadales bacterium]|nr:hypothetical protein [Pseudomonadales bacterium]